MARLDKASVTTAAPALPQEEFEIEGKGSVLIRALSRAQILSLQSAESKGVLYSERRMLALAIVEPEFSEDDIGNWQKSSLASELEALTVRIAEMSGIRKDSQKAAYADFRDES
jgi:hypothetical protein